jgi:protein-disulfide isomerase
MVRQSSRRGAVHTSEADRIGPHQCRTISRRTTDGREASRADAHLMRSRNLKRLAVLVIAAAGVVAVAIAIAAPRKDGAPAPAAQTSSMFAGIPQDGKALGAPEAPATLTEFADLQCPFCADYAREVLPSIVDRYVRTGKLRLELNVLAFLGEDSVRGGRMAAAAASQDRLWPFVDAFYRSQGAENSGYADDAFLRRVGGQAGLDVPAALRDRDAPEASAWLTSAQGAADRSRVQGTPAFFLRVADGKPAPVQPRELTPESFAAALDAALAEH